VGSLHPRCGPTDRDSSHRTRAGSLSSTGVITWNNILGTPFSEGIEIFYLPGSLFVLVAVVTYGLHGMDSEGIRDSWAEAITNIIPAVIALWFAAVAR